MAPTNPFVYGEVVPRSAFVDREAEIDRLMRAQAAELDQKKRGVL